MRFLVDSCVSKFAVDVLRKDNHDVIWIPEGGKDPGDATILQQAYEEERILITADKDFGELVFVFQYPHPTIVRLVNIKAREQGERILQIIGKYQKKFIQQPLITVERFRIRIKYPES